MNTENEEDAMPGGLLHEPVAPVRPMAPARSYRTAGILFFLLVPTIAHVLFSWMGMNPSDDGSILVLARRILDGQIPHRDFICVRPVLTGYLYLPVVLWGGDYTIWISRLCVWLQFATIAWIWTRVILSRLTESQSAAEQFALAFIVFALTAHNFLLTPWHTVDGLWAASIGLALVTTRRPACKLIGYAAMGSACLFKQNFLVLGPAFLVVFADWRQFRCWLALGFPAFCYVAFVTVAGALSDFILQLTSHTDLVQTGVLRYLECWYLYCGFIAGYFGLLVVSGKVGAQLLSLPQAVRRWLVPVGASLLFILSALCLAWSSSASAKFSFVLFGMCVGAIAYFVCHQDSAFERIKFGALVVLVVWTASISVGYNYPVLGGGLAVALLAGYLRNLLPPDDAQNRWPMIWRSCVVASAVITLICFGIGRSKYIYRERPAWELHYPLDKVLAGGKLIHTNPVTYEYMKELDEAIRRLGGREYAIIPDVAIHWVKSLQRNPLPIDWPQDIELARPALFNRVVRALESGRGKTVILAAKVRPFSLAAEPEPITENDVYSIVFYVRSHFRKTGETKYWEIYE